MWLILLLLVGCSTPQVPQYGYFEARKNLGLDRATCDAACQSRLIDERERWPNHMRSTTHPLPFPPLHPTWQMLRTPSGDLYHHYGGGMIQGPHGEIYTVY